MCVYKYVCVCVYMCVSSCVCVNNYSFVIVLIMDVCKFITSVYQLTYGDNTK